MALYWLVLRLVLLLCNLVGYIVVHFQLSFVRYVSFIEGRLFDWYGTPSRYAGNGIVWSS